MSVSRSLLKYLNIEIIHLVRSQNLPKNLHVKFSKNFANIIQGSHTDRSLVFTVNISFISCFIPAGNIKLGVRVLTYTLSLTACLFNKVCFRVNAVSLLYAQHKLKVTTYFQQIG